MWQTATLRLPDGGKGACSHGVGDNDGDKRAIKGWTLARSISKGWKLVATQIHRHKEFESGLEEKSGNRDERSFCLHLVQIQKASLLWIFHHEAGTSNFKQRARFS